MSPRSLLLFRVVILVVLGVSIGALAAMIVPVLPVILAGRVPLANLLYVVITASIVAAASAVTVALLIRCAAAPEGRALAMMLAALTFAAGAAEPLYMMRQAWNLPWLLDSLLDFTAPLAFVVALGSVLRFTTLFPQPLTAAQLRSERVLPRLRVLLLDGRRLWSWLFGIALVAEAGVLSAPALRRLAGGSGPGFPLHKLALIGLILLGLTICVANLRTGYRLSGEVGRRRIYWVLEGLLAGTVVLALASALKILQMAGMIEIASRIWYPLAALGSVLLIILFVAVAMFYAGALDPALAIRRTAATGLVGLAMVFIFAITQQLVQELLVAWLGMSDRAGGMATGGVVALSFEPVQRRLNGLVARWVANPGPAGGPLAAPRAAQGTAAHA